MKRDLQSQWKNKQQNGYKYVLINNYFKCQWTKCSHKKDKEWQIGLKKQTNKNLQFVAGVRHATGPKTHVD